MDLSSLASYAATAMFPYGWLMGLLRGGTGLLNMLFGGGGGPPEHVGFYMLANVPWQVTGQDDSYVYFVPKASWEWPGAYNLTQFRLNKRTGGIEYLQAPRGLKREGSVPPDQEGAVEPPPTEYGYGSAGGQWVPFEGTLWHPGGPERMLVDPRALGSRLYYDVLKPLGLEGLWQGAVPPQVTPSMYQWQPRLESESIPADVANSVLAALAAGKVPELIPFYVKISNQGQPQGAYGLVPTGDWSAQAQAQAGKGVFDMTMGSPIDAADWYRQFFSYLMQSMPQPPAFPVDTYLDALVSQLPAVSDLRDKWERAYAQLEKLSQPLGPLRIGPFNVVPTGAMAKRAQEVKNALAPLGAAGEMLGEVMKVPLTEYAGMLKQMEERYGYDENLLKTLAASAGSYLDFVKDLATAEKYAQLKKDLLAASQPEDWVKLLQASPYALSGLTSLDKIFAKMFGTGLFDWLGGELGNLWDWIWGSGGSGDDLAWTAFSFLTGD